MPKDTGTSIKELKIGPFSGGINTYSDPAMIADDEMTDCRNFDMSLDGSLVSRPPWNVLVATKTTSTAGGTSPPISWQNVIYTGTYEGNRFVVTNTTHVGGNSAAFVYFVEGPAGGSLTKIADGEFSGAHRYANDVYLVPDAVNNASTATGYVWDLAGGLVTPINNMPTGYSSIIYKDRLWISGRRNVPNNSRLFFSEIADFDNWPGTNFFDINPGDGDAVHQLAVYQDNIVIFKDNATYVLAYDTGPAQAVLQVINTDIGATGRYTVDAYENSIFVLKYNQVYEMSNYDFVRVSVKLPFEYDESLSLTNPPNSEYYKWAIWLRVVGDRLVVRFYNRIYVYHLRLRSWTRWESLDENINYLGPIRMLDNTNTANLRGYETYVAGSCLGRNVDAQGPGTSGAWNMYFKIFKFEDRYNSTNTENGNIVPAFPSVAINLTMTTKQLDVGLSHRFKKLMHWGVDCYTGNSVTGTLYPFSIAYKIPWSSLLGTHWHDLNTWEYPLQVIPSTTQEIGSGTGLQVKFVRFPKALRFRLLKFQVDMSTVGNLTDGPAYLYSITAFIGAKQIVPNAVN